MKIRKKSQNILVSCGAPSWGVSQCSNGSTALKIAPHEMPNDGCKGEYESHSQGLTFGEGLFISSRVVKKIESSRRDGKSNSGDFAVC